MSMEKHGAAIAEAMARYRAGQMSRRQVVRLLGTLGVGLTAAGAIGLGRGRSTDAAAPSGHGKHTMFGLRQDGTPGAEGPPPAATPPLGQQADGTTTWKVQAGAFGAEEFGVELVAFFPEQITVNAGDSVFFAIQGFHNVHFYPGGGQPVPLFIPDMSGTPTAGPPRIVLNPQVAFPTPTMTVDGATEVNSGLPLGPSGPVVMSFSTPGTYEYWCDIHAAGQMKGTVVVQEAGAAAPMDQAAVDQAAQAEMDALRQQAQALIDEHLAMSGTPMAGTPMAGGAHEVAVGLSAIEIEVNAFFPRDLTVAAGDTVRWVYTSNDPAVPHTVTFLGGGDPLEFVVPEGGQAGPPTLVLNPQLLLPTGGPTYSGQGLANSGLFGGGPGSPTSFELTFDTAGSYAYYCAIHGSPEGGMAGTITVQ